MVQSRISATTSNCYIEISQERWRVQVDQGAWVINRQNAASFHGHFLDLESAHGAIGFFDEQKASLAVAAVVALFMPLYPVVQACTGIV